ncbi:MAG: hypothetical protein ACREQI_07015 [Candidatus Binataceae bacterium]
MPLSREKRDEIRAQALARYPRWYNPRLHLPVLTAYSFVAIAISIGLIKDLAWWELLAVPITWVLFIPVEWIIHRDLDVGQSLLSKKVYDHHTPEHHLLYISEDMGIRDWREIGLLLTKASGILLANLTLLAPVAAAAWIAGFRNIGLLYFATGTAFSLSEELFHVACHLPDGNRIAEFRLVRFVRRNHAIHHDPRLGLKSNFNTIIPLWDWMVGTYVSDHAAALATRRSNAARPTT